MEKLLKNPRVVYVPKEVIVEKECNHNIAEIIDKVLRIYEKKKNRLIKELMFAVYFYYGRYRKYFKENMRSKETQNFGFLLKKIR